MAQSESNLLSREALRMKQKRGVIPRKIWNSLVDTMFAGMVTTGVGCKISRSKGGTSIEVPRRPFDMQRHPPPFYPVSIVPVPASSPKKWAVNLRPGWVIETNRTADEEALIYHMPVVGESPNQVALNDEDPPDIEVGDGEIVYVVYETNAAGKIATDPAPCIDVTSVDDTGTHYIPPDGDSGTTGEYRRKILKIDADGDSFDLTLYQQSDIEHYAEAEEETGGTPGTDPVGLHCNMYVHCFSLSYHDSHGSSGYLLTRNEELYIIYFRHGHYCGNSDESGLPPWHLDSTHYDAGLYPDHTDPAGSDPIAIYQLVSLPDEYGSGWIDPNPPSS